jgi:hypothetical protein
MPLQMNVGHHDFRGEQNEAGDVKLLALRDRCGAVVSSDTSNSGFPSTVTVAGADCHMSH